MLHPSKNVFTGEISKLVTKSNHEDVIKELDNLKARNWKVEIRNFGNTFGLETQKILKNIEYFLVDSMDSKELRQELESNAAHYKQYYDKFQKESFHNAERVVDSILQYIERITEYHAKRIEFVLLSNPGIEENAPEHIKSYLLGEPYSKKEEVDLHPMDDKEIPVQEQKVAVNIPQNQIENDKKDPLEHKILEIIDENITEKEKILKITELCTSIFKMKRMSWEKLSKVLGLEKTYADELLNKFVDTDTIRLLINFKNNPNSEEIRDMLERLISRVDISNKTPKTNIESVQDTMKEIDEPKSIHLKPTGQIIQLSERDMIRFRKDEPKKNQEEIMQGPTTNLLDYVGQKINRNIFLDDSKSYKELRISELRREPVAAQYRGYSPKPTKSGKVAHFFTVGKEVRGIHDNIPVNAYIEQDPNVRFEEGVIYKVRIIGILPSNRTGANKQSMSVQGELVIDTGETLGSGNFLGNGKNGTVLENLQRQLQGDRK